MRPRPALDDEHPLPSHPRPLRADAERNRRRLLIAAEEVFATRGLEATLDEIAAQAGVGVGTAYRRFANKQEIIDALFELRMNGMIELAEACALMDDAGEGLTRLLRETCSAITADRGFREVLLHGTADSAGTSDRKMASIRERFLPILIRLVEQAQASGMVRSDFRPLDLPLVILMMESVADATDRLDPHLWERYLALVMDGMCHKSAPTPLPGAPLDLEQTEQAMNNRHNRAHRL